MTQSKPKSYVKILPEEKNLEISNAKSLMLLLLENKVDISHICGGFASCGTCRVIVESNPDDLPPRNDLETEVARERNFDKRERLSCQLCPYDGLMISLPKKRKGATK